MDWAITLLILEGIPLLALIYFLRHKKEMYLWKRKSLCQTGQNSC
jgi:hypothetical protein